MKAHTIRKSIDLDPDTLQLLSFDAVAVGLSPKRYIEKLLHDIAEAHEDRMLVKLAKEADHELLSPEEQEEFLNYLRSIKIEENK